MTTQEEASQAIQDALVGTWMPLDYCDCLKRERSAHACRELANEVFVMLVRPSSGDSLIWSFITPHEGGPEELLAFDGPTSSFVFTPEADRPWVPSVRLRSIDADHAELRLDDSKGRIHLRVQSEDSLLNATLLAGKYALDPSGAVVEFNTNGAVEGLAAHTRFTILTDFTEGFDNLDIVFLHNGGFDWSSDAFHYRWEGSELLLTHMDTTADPYVYQQGELIYRLQALRDQ